MNVRPGYSASTSFEMGATTSGPRLTLHPDHLPGGVALESDPAKIAIAEIVHPVSQSAKTSSSLALVAISRTRFGCWYFARWPRS